MNPESVGVLAALVSTGSLAPQVYRTWRLRSARDLSYEWLLIALIGAALWSVYGLMRSDWAIVIANSLIGIMILMLVAMKRVYSSSLRA